MSDKIQFELIGNYEKDMGNLIPTIYSSKKFIEYIAKYLKNNDEGLQHEYVFEAGNKMAVNIVQLNKNKTKVTYSYNEGNPPVGSVNNFTAEYGKQFASGELDLHVKVTRKSYPLKLIEWASQVTPVIYEDQVSLGNLQLNQSYTKTIHNANALGPEETLVATGGKYEDMYGQSGTLESHITRQARQFWGSILNTTDSYDIHDSSFNSTLGGLPHEITIHHGSTPSHFIIVTTQNIEVYANGMKIGMTKESNVNQNPYSPDLTYTKPYNVYTSTGKSTGDYKYTIKTV